MAQAVSRRPVIAEAWVRAQVGPCGILGGQSSIGTGFSPGYSVSLCQYYSTVASILIYHLEDEKIPVDGLQFRDIVPLHPQEQHEQLDLRVGWKNTSDTYMTS
jgi:hypothetical protein